MKKKSISLFILALLWSLGAEAQVSPLISTPSSDINYVLTRTYRIAGVNTVNLSLQRNNDEENHSIQYFDGVGRLLQTITLQGSPGGLDIVQPNSYDIYGREAMKYPAYTAAANGGAYRVEALQPGLGLESFYSSPPSGVKSTNNPFSLTSFEYSPLSRVIEESAPGEAWKPSVFGGTHTNKMAYNTNITGEVRNWTINSTNDGANGASFYPEASLYKEVKKDENWKYTDGKSGTVEEFKDLDGKLILKRVWESSIKSLSTYYVYDDFDKLRYVLPPAVNENGQGTVSSFTEATNDPVFGIYVYAYRYDGLGRLIHKKVPSKGWEYLAYNKLDQVVLSQDANQRLVGKWSFTKYDAHGRVVINGLYNDGSSLSSMQAQLDTWAVNENPLWEQRAGSGIGYTNQSFPQSIAYYHSINYYDNYDFPTNSFGAPTGVQAAGIQTKGLATGNMTTVLGTGDMLLSVSYYDLYGRATQVKSQHYLTGSIDANNYDEVNNTYDFSGQLQSSARVHHSTAGNTTIVNTYSYDHMGRKLSTSENINSQGEVKLNRLEYNEIGQLRKKSLHGSDTTFLQHSYFTYNERGWMKESKSTQFRMQLDYQDGTHPQYNGNISNQRWGSSLGNVYTYQYDRLNRLVNGTTTAGTVPMSEVLTYDVMGNINTLSRYDGTTTKVGAYDYSGNQLTGISAGELETDTYYYDANGNATTDGRIGATVNYNHLNLPIAVDKIGALSIVYTYDATGQKLKKVSNLTGTTDYVDGIQYQDGSIDFIQTEEGIARNNNGTYVYEYNLTDHLGNVRYTFNKHPTTGLVQPLQQDDYYAFGKRFGSGGTNKYLYNGKELQDELGQYDYGARFYDPVVGRWNVVDPLAEKRDWLSPYNYVQNNPIIRVDPTGALDDYKLNQDGNIELIKRTDDKNDVLYATNTSGEVDESKSLVIEKGILSNISEGQNSTGQKFNYMKINNDNTASKLFEFAANNTNVEWGQVKFGSKSNYVSTSHERSSEFGAGALVHKLYKDKYTVREHIHSHPYKDPEIQKAHGPSGFGIGGDTTIAGDKAFSIWLKERMPNAKTSVYDVTLKKYIRFNTLGIIE